MTQPIEVQNLKKFFGNFQAVHFAKAYVYRCESYLIYLGQEKGVYQN